MLIKIKILLGVFRLIYNKNISYSQLRKNSKSILFVSNGDDYILTIRNTNEDLCILWTIDDFETQANDEFNRNPDGYSSVEHMYDFSQFPQLLAKMIKHHDANIGITWDTVSSYLEEAKIKKSEF